MYKDLIKKHLKVSLAENTPGITNTKKVQDDEAKENKKAMKDTAKRFEEYEDASAQEDTNKIEPPKRNHTESEKEYHDDAEIMNGMESLRYDGDVNDAFKTAQEMQIAGHSKTGNKTYTGKWNPETGEGNGNTEPVWGASDAEFGQKLIDKIKRSAKKKEDATQAFHQFGDDIEVAAGDPKISKRNVAVESVKASETLNEDVMADKNYTHFAIHKPTGKIINAWNYSGYEADDLKAGKDEYFFNDLIQDFNIPKKSDAKIITRRALDKSGINPEDVNNWYRPANENSNNNKTEIKESKMKRLKFGQPFGGRNNALKLIPEHYKVDNKVFEMTDGNETYKVRWETNGGVILESKNQNKINEDMAHMKHLMGYTSRETLGTLKGEDRIAENKSFRGFMDKAEGLITEDADGNRVMVNEVNTGTMLAYNDALEAGKIAPDTASDEEKAKKKAEKKGVNEMEDPNDGTTKTETDPGDEINSQAPEAKEDILDKDGKKISQDKAPEADPSGEIKEGEEEEDETMTEMEEVPTTSPEALPSKEAVSKKGPDTK